MCDARVVGAHEAAVAATRVQWRSRIYQDALLFRHKSQRQLQWHRSQEHLSGGCSHKPKSPVWEQSYPQRAPPG